MYARPFEVPVNNRLEYISIVVPLIILYGGLLFYSGKVDSTTETVITVFLITLFCVAAILIIAALYNHIRLLYAKITKPKSKQGPSKAEKQKEMEKTAMKSLFGSSYKYVRDNLTTKFNEHEQEQFLRYCTRVIYQNPNEGESEMQIH